MSVQVQLKRQDTPADQICTSPLATPAAPRKLPLPACCHHVPRQSQDAGIAVPSDLCAGAAEAAGHASGADLHEPASDASASQEATAPCCSQGSSCEAAFHYRHQLQACCRSRICRC